MNARAPAIDVGLAERALWSDVGFTRGKRRVTVPRGEIIAALANGPGWVGADHTGCSDTTPVELDYGDAISPRSLP